MLLLKTLGKPTQISLKYHLVNVAYSSPSNTSCTIAQVDSSATISPKNRTFGSQSNVPTARPRGISFEETVSPGASNEVSNPLSAILNSAAAPEETPAIGIVFQDSKFKCNKGQCAHRTFGRLAELKRHYQTTHSAQKPELWCTVPSCERSAAVTGSWPFLRQDNLRVHVQKVHNHETA